jgi:hypothetical protein
MPSSVQAQLELGQPLEEGTRELDPLADRDNDVGVGEAPDELIERGRRLAIAHHVVMADQVEAFELVDHVLVVVRNDDLHGGALSGRSIGQEYSQEWTRD